VNDLVTYATDDKVSTMKIVVKYKPPLDIKLKEIVRTKYKEYP
jgi:hypothetical protein